MSDALVVERVGVTVPEIPPSLAEKVHDLLDAKRVLVTAGFVSDVSMPPFHYAYVLGDHEAYVVRADRHAVRCSCWAAQVGRPCAHRLAAMAVWAEQAGA